MLEDVGFMSRLIRSEGLVGNRGEEWKRNEYEGEVGVRAEVYIAGS